MKCYWLCNGLAYSPLFDSPSRDKSRRKRSTSSWWDILSRSESYRAQPAAACCDKAAMGVIVEGGNGRCLLGKAGKDMPKLEPINDPGACGRKPGRMFGWCNVFEASKFGAAISFVLPRVLYLATCSRSLAWPSAAINRGSLGNKRCSNASPELSCVVRFGGRFETGNIVSWWRLEVLRSSDNSLDCACVETSPSASLKSPPSRVPSRLRFAFSSWSLRASVSSTSNSIFFLTYLEWYEQVNNNDIWFVSLLSQGKTYKYLHLVMKLTFFGNKWHFLNVVVPAAPLENQRLLPEKMPPIQASYPRTFDPIRIFRASPRPSPVQGEYLVLSFLPLR